MHLYFDWWNEDVILIVNDKKFCMRGAACRYRSPYNPSLFDLLIICKYCSAFSATMRFTLFYILTIKHNDGNNWSINHNFLIEPTPKMALFYPTKLMQNNNSNNKCFFILLKLSSSHLLNNCQIKSSKIFILKKEIADVIEVAYLNVKLNTSITRYWPVNFTSNVWACIYSQIALLLLKPNFKEIQ